MTVLSPSGSPEFGRPLRSTLWPVILLALGLLVLNLLTARWMPLELIDEVLLSDAGINLAQGQGFTSTAWPDQGAAEFFGGNLPLYPAALAAWCKVFGFSLTAWRGFTYAAGSLAAVVLALALRRLGVLRSSAGAVCFVGFAFTVGPGFEALRLARYDALQMLLLALVALAWSMPAGPRRAVALLLGGALLAASGVQAAFYAGLWCLAALWWQRAAAVRRVGALGAGMLLGAGIVAAIWTSQHAWAGFLGNMALTKALESEHGGRWGMAYARLIYYPLVLVNFPLMALAYTVAAWPAWRARFWLPLLGLALLAVLLQVAIHFRFYYYWMVALPLALAIAQAAEANLGHAPWQRGLLGLLLALLALYGPVKLLGLAWASNVEGQRREFAQFVQQHLQPNDRVIAEWSCYSTVKRVAARVYLPSYLGRITPEESAEVTAVLAHAHSDGASLAERQTTLGWMDRTGARWVPVAEAPRLHPRPVWSWLQRYYPAGLARYAQKLQDLQVVLYRRAESTEAPKP